MYALAHNHVQYKARGEVVTGAAFLYPSVKDVDFFLDGFPLFFSITHHYYTRVVENPLTKRWRAWR